MHLSELSYKPKLGGGAHGNMMLHVSVEGPESPSPSWTVMDVVNRCEQASNMMSMKIKITLVKPTFDAEGDEVTQLLMMLRDRGFTVGLVLEGYSIPVYAREAQFIQAIISGPHWDNFKVSELVYKPDDLSDLTEPIILQNNLTANKYLYVGKKFGPRDVIKFLQQAQFPWGLVVPPAKEISVDFLGGGNE